jgi:hypothetical protein
VVTEFMEAVEKQASEAGQPDPGQWPTTLALAYRAVQFWMEDYVVAPGKWGGDINPLRTAHLALDALNVGVESWGRDDDDPRPARRWGINYNKE